MVCEDERICFAFVFACMVGKNPKTPKLSPMADNAITPGGIGCLGSLVYICGMIITCCLIINSHLYQLCGFHATTSKFHGSFLEYVRKSEPFWQFILHSNDMTQDVHKVKCDDKWTDNVCNAKFLLFLWEMKRIGKLHHSLWSMEYIHCPYAPVLFTSLCTYCKLYYS